MRVILIKENDDSIWEILSAAFEMEGYDTTRLENDPEKNLQIVKFCKPIFLLIEFWICGNSTDKTCELVKLIYPNIPIIAFSCENQIDSL